MNHRKSNSLFKVELPEEFLTILLKVSDVTVDVVL